ncbi:methyltransferase [Actinomadura welshii]|uniref:methyltransferase n=1 Tax=Actinomadura welshii TaxID=3103817 RepID=UPI0006947862|nr:methyltransferase [Actinomadura madurae]
MAVPADQHKDDLLRPLRAHPWIEDARFAPDGETVRIRPAASALAVRPALGGLVEEYLEHWGEVYDWTYTEAEGRRADDLDLSGWRASDTGRPLPAGHMREWVDHTVGLVLSVRPRWILELGCGTGLLTHRLRGHVSGYVGTDVAGTAVRKLSARALPGTTFVRAAAHEARSPQVLAALEAGGFPDARPDCVLLNSVTQCFPGVAYLEAVLRDAVELVAAGGTVIVGDVRDARLLRDFCRWAERAQAPDADARELARRAAQRAARDPELLFDPPLIAGLAVRAAAETGRSLRMSVHPKTMRDETELTRYRFDAVLHVDASATPTPKAASWDDSAGDEAAALNVLLETEPVAVHGIPRTSLPAARLRELVGERAAVIADPADPARLGVVAPPEAAAVPVEEIAGRPGTAHDPFPSFGERRLGEIARAVLRRDTAVEIDRGDGRAGLPERAGRAAARAVDTDPAGLPVFLRRLDEVALRAMASTLRPVGLTVPEERLTADEIADGVHAAARHRWILRRWLHVLVAEGRVVRHDDGRYGALRPMTRREVAAAAEGVVAEGEESGYPAKTAGLMLTAMARLPELLRDELSMRTLLFGDDGTEAADGAYRENTVNRYLNGAVGEVLRWAGENNDHGGALRVLELGAGVGGTTADALAALAGTEIDYLFTDLSRYFLSLGRERFGGRDGVRFAIFDINRDAAVQGVAPGSFDVVLSANVLHNARHVGGMLAGLADLLAPGGLFVFVETTRELYSILTSMQFLMSAGPGEERLHPDDPRAAGDRIFLTGEEWSRELGNAGLRPWFTLPHDDHPLAEAGLRLFVARLAR